MEEAKTSIGLDNPIFSNRLRLVERDYEVLKKADQPKHYGSGDVVPAELPEKVSKTVSIAEEQVVATTSKTDSQPIKKEPTKRPIVFNFDDIDKSNQRHLPAKFKAKKPLYKFVSNSLVVFAVLLLGFGLYVAVSGLITNKAITNVVNAQGNRSAAGGYKEQKPTDDDLNNYHVAADMPRFIEIPSLGVKARVFSLGVDKKGQMAVPSNIFDVGWYNQSAKPGSLAGASVIDGHVSGPTQPGSFYDLKNVQNGDVITVERGDGKKFSYKVIGKEVQEPNKLDMTKVLVSKDTNKAALNLITCTGKVTGHEYSQRLVVYTEAMF